MFEARFYLPTKGSIQITHDAGDYIKVRELNVFNEELWEMEFNEALNLFESISNVLNNLSFEPAEVDE